MASQQDDGSDPSRGRSLESGRREQEVHAGTNTRVSVLLIPAPDQLETPVRMTLDDLRPTTTVGEIRSRAQSIIASQPDLGRIRLIHSGRLLSRDGQTLEDLVGFDAAQLNNTVAIHLILRPLPGGVRPQPLTRSASPAGVVANGSHGVFAQGAPVAHQPNIPLLQPAPVQNFPPRPSSTPAMPHTQGPYPVPLHQQAAGGFATHGIPNAQQAQFMQQLQQQHLNMMQAMLRQAPQNTVPQVPSGNQMTLPDFQRLYNQQAQARQAQQAGMSGRTTPQGANYAGRANGGAQIPQNIASQQNPTDGQSPPEHLQQQIHHFQRHAHINATVPAATANPPRAHLGSSGPPSWLTAGMASNYAHAAQITLSADHETVFLLSSPAGHEAILIGPRGSQEPWTEQQGSSSTRLATGSTGGQHTGGAAVGQPNAPNQGDAVQRGHIQGQPVQLRDLLALVMPLGGQLWLIVRLAGVVALLTLNATWSRTLLIWLIAFIIYLAQTDVLNPVQRAAEQVWVPVRHHIEGLVRDVEDEQQGAIQDNLDPGQAAARLLRRQRDQSILRRVERGIALFVASFVPGVGEAQVAMREAAERRRGQEERARLELAQQVSQQGNAADGVASPSTRVEDQTQSVEVSGNAVESPRDQDTIGDESTVRRRQPHVEDTDE